MRLRAQRAGGRAAPGGVCQRHGACIHSQQATGGRRGARMDKRTNHNSNNHNNNNNLNLYHHNSNDNSSNSDR